jgi:sugar O-acyltransferase (sialic acid O-acetyltransferase NeuD family)
VERLLVVGSSGHAHAVLSVALATERFEIVGLVDDLLPAGQAALGYSTVGGVADAPAICKRLDVHALFVAIGDNFQRQRVSERLAALVPDIPLATLIHPSTVVGRDATLGAGTVAMPRAVVGAGSQVGEGCILNTGSSLDHDSVLGDWASLAPGVTTGGRVRVGVRTFVGLGANVIQGISIGADTVIGAGSLVLSDLGSGVLAYGSPCRSVRERRPDEAYL